METKTVARAIELNTLIGNKRRHRDYIKNALKECKQDETDLFWSSYGCLCLYNGWGKNDVKRLLNRVESELSKLEKELEAL